MTRLCAFAAALWLLFLPSGAFGVTKITKTIPADATSYLYGMATYDRWSCPIWVSTDDLLHHLQREFSKCCLVCMLLVSLQPAYRLDYHHLGQCQWNVQFVQEGCEIT